MKYADIQRIRDAGLITDEQQRQINEHFKLKEDSNRFLAIISFVGAILVAAGIILLIASNWEEIPRGVKLAAGLVLMLGAHGAGWWLREKPIAASDGERSVVGRVRGLFPKTGEALHLAGSLLFLGNIALVGQIYHLVSRPPNAILLWWAGIAGLPWLLKSEVQHLLVLLAFGIWFGMEANTPGSVAYLQDASQLLAYALLGLVYFGLGLVLRRSGFASFAKITERLGLLAVLVFSYPLTWRGFMGSFHDDQSGVCWFLLALALLAMLLAALGAKNLVLDRQWRWTWTLALVAAAGLLVAAFYAPHERIWGWHREFTPVNAGAALALFVFCLLQIQVGLQERSTFFVNLGVVFIALDIIAAYLGLFGTMAFTGLMFVVSGVFLIVFGVYLEKKRRALMQQIKVARTGVEVPS